MLHVISEALFALIAKSTYWKMLKIFLFICYSGKQNLFLLPLYTNLKLIIVIKKKTLTQVLFLEFCKISKYTFSYRTHPMADSGVNAFYLVENDLFILVVSNINILDNGNNILEKYKDIPKNYAQI